MSKKIFKTHVINVIWVIEWFGSFMASFVVGDFCDWRDLKFYGGSYDWRDLGDSVIYDNLLNLLKNDCSTCDLGDLEKNTTHVIGVIL